MATSSIFTNVRIEDSSKAKVFINALEKAAGDAKKIAQKNKKLLSDEKKIYDSFVKSVKK